MPAGSKPGERRGGRTKGKPNNASQERQAKVAAGGITPLDVMLENMRFAWDQAAGILDTIMANREPRDGDDNYDAFKEMMRFRKLAQECATDASPYVHPKLASVEHRGDAENPIEHSIKVRFVSVKSESAGQQP